MRGRYIHGRFVTLPVRRPYHAQNFLSILISVCPPSTHYGNNSCLSVCLSVCLCTHCHHWLVSCLVVLSIPMLTSCLSRHSLSQFWPLSTTSNTDLLLSVYTLTSNDIPPAFSHKSNTNILYVFPLISNNWLCGGSVIWGVYRWM